MIWESSYWKEDLLRTASFLRDFGATDDWNERTQVRLEKEVMGAAYSIRKLKDAKKLSEEVLKVQAHAERFPSTGKHVDQMNWHHVDKLYDFDRGQRHTLSLTQFCNQLIHSWVFMSEEAEDGSLGAILVCSDKDRNECLFRVERDEILKVLEAVGSDDPDAFVKIREPDTGDFKVRNFKGMG